MKIRKLIALMMVLVLALGVLGACGKTETEQPAAEAEGAPAAEEKVEGDLIFWTQDTVTWQNYFNPALERFKAAYPDVNVQVEYFSSFADKINQSFAANTEADVIFTWQSISDWAKAGRVQVIPDSVYSAADFEKYFFSGATMNKVYDGKYYAVPNEINVESPQLFVNLDLLESMGVALPEGWVENNGPASWDELIAFAKTVTVKDATGAITQNGLSYCYAQWEAMLPSLIWQQGGDYRDAANNTVHLDTEEARNAVEFMLRYLGTGEDAVCQGTDNRYDEFAQGRAAMCIGAPWYAGSFAIDIPETKYQVFNMPAFIEGADPACLATGGWGYTVSSNCKNNPAAWAFVKFMTSAEEVGDWAYTTGALPARNDSLTDLTYDANVGSVDKAIAIAMDILQYAQEDGAYMLTPSTLIYTIIREALAQVLEDGDVDACIQRIQSEAEMMIMENNER